MATKYANFDLATGGNNGTTKADAWQTLAAAFAGVADGDIVLCTGTDTSGGTLATVGTVANGGIRFLSYDSTLTNPEVGSAIIDGGGSVAVPLTFGSTATFVEMVGFEIKNATDNCVAQTASDGVTLIDCSIHDATNEVIDCTAESMNLIHCLIYNGTRGVSLPTNADIRNCIFHDLSGSAIFCTASSINLTGNLFYDIGVSAFEASNSNYLIAFNTVDGCTGSGVWLKGATTALNAQVLFKNRFTNNGGYGLLQDNASGVIIGDYNAFYNNTSGATSIAATYWGGANDINMSSDGYTNRAGKDFSLIAAAEARDIATYLGWRKTGVSVVSYEVAGALSPQCVTSGGAQLGFFKAGAWK